MPPPAVDPVHRTSYTFTRQGETLTVTATFEAGAELPTHSHPRQQEVWWLESGTLEFHLDGTWTTITSGTGKITVPRGTVHGLRNTSGREAVGVAEATPALDLQEFLVESAAAARKGWIRRGGIPGSLTGARWAASFLDRFADQTVMTFPPPALQKLVRPLGRIGDPPRPF
ncbi:MAG: cupin domain-containing protein [Solirubrobacterales bacterium]